MSKKHVLLGMASVSLCVFAGGAEAKLIRYEIDGQRYSYSTNNRQQTKEARQRIEAAAAAKAGKAQGEAEAAANPLARIFGTQAQRDAAAAQTGAQQTGTGSEADIADTSSVRRSRTRNRHVAARATARAERRQTQREARLERKKEARLERTRQVKLTRAQRLAARSTGSLGSGARTKQETPAAAQPEATPISATPPIVTPQPSSAAAPSEPRRERASGDAGGSLTDFVNQMRKAPPEERAPRS
jgi:hypothetical protein